MVDRQEVEELLSSLDNWVDPDSAEIEVSGETLAALCRAWLAVDEAPTVIATEWIWESIPQELEYQRVRIVKEVG